MDNKRLYKSSVNYMLCGVCGGIAEYFNIDPTLVRLAWVILTCFGGAGIWNPSSFSILLASTIPSSGRTSAGNSDIYSLILSLIEAVSLT